MTPDRFEEPAGLAYGHFKSAQGADIRYARVAPEGEVKGRVVILPGFRESIEKYHELMRDFLARGFEVWTMDWKGQGGSSRYLAADAMKSHHAGYEEQIEILHQLTQQVMGPSTQPTIMAAHSMGAHLGLRYLKEHAGVFDSAILTAPMLEIETGVMPRPLARQVAKFAKAGNYLDKYVPNGHAWTASDHVFDGNDKTGDPERFYNWVHTLEKNPALQMGDATYGWIYHTFKSCDVLNDENYLKSITTPVLMASAGADTVVSNSAQARAASLLPACRQVIYPTARHEIWQEADSIRKPWLAEADGFIASRLAHRQEQDAAAKKRPPHNPPRPPLAA